MKPLHDTLRRLAKAAARVLMALSVAPVAHAALIPCTPVAGGFTVFLSEPEFTRAAFKGPDEMREFMQRLTRLLDNPRDRVWAKSPNPNPAIHFVYCEGRAPALGGQDFVPAVIDTMHFSRVLLEVWGLLDAEGSAGGAPRPSAQIRFLLVPMKFAANRNEPAATPLQRLDYVAPAGEPATDFVNLIGKPQPIDAFVAAALGFKLLRERSFELAHRNLCYAGAQLQQFEKRLQPGRERDDIAALQTFVLASAARAIDGARESRPAGARPADLSPLTLQDATNPCALEVEP